MKFTIIIITTEVPLIIQGKYIFLIHFVFEIVIDICYMKVYFSS